MPMSESRATATEGVESGVLLRQASGRRSTRSSSRGRCSSPPNTVPPAVPNALPTPNIPATSTPQGERKRKRQRSACGKHICGVWASTDKCQACAGSPCHAEQLLCYACHQGPVETSGGRLNWRHFQGAEEVSKAAATWREKMESGGLGLHTVAKPGVSPSLVDCFCSRTRCMHSLLMRWRREAEQEKRWCTICAVKTSRAWRMPGAVLDACRDLFSQRDPKNPGKTPLGNTLQAGSKLCHKCYMKGFNHSVKRGEGAKLNVAGSPSSLTATQSPKREIVQIVQ